MNKRHNQEHKEYNQIFDSDLPDLEKVAEAFGYVTSQLLDHGQKELELFQAMGDKDSAVKKQINLETIRFTRGVLNEAYQRVTGRKAWDE